MESKVSENVFHIIGVYMIIIFLLSQTLNIFVVFIFSRILKKKSNSVTLTIINISAANIFQACVYPLNVISAFKKDHYLGDEACTIEGFVVTWFSITAITLLTCLGYERLRIVKVVQPTELKLTKYELRRIGACWFHGLFWAAAPLLGWSAYASEGIAMNCSIDWRLRTFTGLSYTTSIAIAAFFVPIFVISFAYGNIWKITKKRSVLAAKELNGENGSYCIRTTNVKKQTDLAITGFVMSISFCSAWLPYAVVSVMAAICPYSVSPMQATIPSIIAKSSTVYLPFIYGMRHTAFRIECIKLFRRAGT